jgi:hypothetical protein
LRQIFFVAARCSSTADAIDVAISLTRLIVAVIASGLDSMARETLAFATPPWRR